MSGSVPEQAHKTPSYSPIEMTRTGTEGGVGLEVAATNDESGSANSSSDALVEDEQQQTATDDSGVVDYYGAGPSFMEALFCFIFCVVGNAVTLSALFWVEPHERPMPYQYLEESNEYVRRLSNNEAFEGETIDTISLFLLCIFCPLAVQFACNFIFGEGLSEGYRTACTYSVAVTLTGFATEFLKNYVGYLRPIFFTECVPDAQYDYCTGDGSEIALKELRKSFVSGHASLSFCGCVLLTLYLERTFGLSSVEVAVSKPMVGNSSRIQWTVSYRKHPGLRRMGSIVALLPLCVAIWSAASRLVDNVHFPADVVGGAVLGASIAAYCHPLWFPQPRFIPSN